METGRKVSVLSVGKFENVGYLFCSVFIAAFIPHFHRCTYFKLIILILCDDLPVSDTFLKSTFLSFLFFLFLSFIRSSLFHVFKTADIIGRI